MNMKHTAVITSMPKRSGRESIPDGALTGNGDLSAILGNNKKGMRVFIAKCDLWKANEHHDSDGGIKPLGYIDFDIPEKLYSNYYAEQRMDEGEIYCHFSDGENYADIKIIVCAVKNDIYFETSASSEQLISKPHLTVFNCNADELKSKKYDDTQIITRTFNNNLKFSCTVSCGMREFAKNKYILSAATNFDSDTAEKDILSHLADFNEEQYQSEKSSHYKWWKDFYSKSEFTIDDEQLELNWYACQYHLAI